jgi:hypothetical protein
LACLLGIGWAGGYACRRGIDCAGGVDLAMMLLGFAGLGYAAFRQGKHKAAVA